MNKLFFAAIVKVFCFMVASKVFSAELTNVDNKHVSKEIIFSGDMGGKVGQLGAFTRGELRRKSDPLAFVDSLPNDFEVGLEGNIYIVDTANHRVQVFNKNGKVINVYTGCGVERFDFPVKIAITKQGNIIISNSYTDLSVLSTSGSCLNKIDNKLFHGYNLGTDVSRIYLDKYNLLHVTGVNKELIFSDTYNVLDYKEGVIENANNKIDLIINKIGREIDGYSSYLWKETLDGNIHAIAINIKNKKNAFRIYRFNLIAEGKLPKN